MSKIKIQLVEDEQETPSVFEWMWSSLMTFAKCIGIFVFICFALGYISTKQAQAKQCESTKTVLARSIFK